MKPRPNSLSRRDLLRGRARRPATAAAPDPTRAGSAHAVDDLLKGTRPAMGSYFEVRLPARTPGGVDLLTRALDRIDDLEAQLTVYRDDSEVSRLNAEAHRGPLPVEPGLFDLLNRAVDLSRRTGGAYDVAAGALSEAWGFVRGPKRVPDPETLADARARTGSQHLLLDSARRTLAFDRPGIRINLGSIGKGYAIDRAAALIRDHVWPTPALIHGGRSSLYALGSPPGTLGGRWEIALRNPLDPEQPLGTIRLRNRGLGTSGDAFQRFEAGGRVYGHILDPRTGEPAPPGGPLSVTVLAPTAAEADALSTAFTLLGPASTAEFLADAPGVGALFVLPPGDGDRPRVVALGIGPEDFEPDGGPASRFDPR